MFTSDRAYIRLIIFGLKIESGFAVWIDAKTGVWVSEDIVYSHIVRNGLHIRAVVDDDEPEGVEWTPLPGIDGLELDQ
jgi:hypothetical protein